MTGHSINPNSLVMCKPDGTPMSRQEVIVERRGAFKWLPVLFSNDLVHGSWWFVLGSFGCMISAVVPLSQQYLPVYSQHDDMLPHLDFVLTWIFLMLNGFFYTLGSLAFVRAFEEPPKVPLLKKYKHFQSDELLGAWLFLAGTLPALPYCFVFFTIEPGMTYLTALIVAGISNMGCVLFVLGCYPSDKKSKNYLLPMCIRCFGAKIWIVKHLANDWIAGCWFFLWGSVLLTLLAVFYFFLAIGRGCNGAQLFVWGSGTINSILFLIGSLYFVSGSYPHAQQYYYAVGRVPCGDVGGEAENLEDIELSKNVDGSLQNDKLGTINPLIPGDMTIPNTYQPRVIKPTQSQTMNLRLNTTVNPLVKQDILSSAGNVVSSTAVPFSSKHGSSTSTGHGGSHTSTAAETSNNSTNSSNSSGSGTSNRNQNGSSNSLDSNLANHNFNGSKSGNKKAKTKMKDVTLPDISINTPSGSQNKKYFVVDGEDVNLDDDDEDLDDDYSVGSSSSSKVGLRIK